MGLQSESRIVKGNLVLKKKERESSINVYENTNGRLIEDILKTRGNLKLFS